MSQGAIIRPWAAEPDESVIGLLQAILEDARKPGGPTTIAIITVSADGMVQTPGRGHQVRELIRGADELRRRLEETYGQAVAAARRNPEAPLRPA